MSRPNRRFKLYCRAARHKRWRDGARMETSMTYNPNPLTVGSRYAGEEAVHTAFFVLDVTVPGELLERADLPVVAVTIDTSGATTVTPTIEQGEQPVFDAVLDEEEAADDDS